MRLSPAERPGNFIRAWGVPRLGPTTSFQANVRLGNAYVVRCEGAAPPPAHIHVSLRDAARAGDPVSVTIPVGDPGITVAVYRVDATKQRRPLPLGGETARRDPRTGSVTLNLVTPELGAALSVEIVRAK